MKDLSLGTSLAILYWKVGSAKHYQGFGRNFDLIVDHEILGVSKKDFANVVKKICHKALKGTQDGKFTIDNCYRIQLRKTCRRFGCFMN